MKRITVLAAFMVALTASAAAAYGQEHQTPSTRTQSSTPQQAVSRDATREKVRAVLTAMGPKLNIDFRQSDKQPYNFVGVLKTGLRNADAFEIVISVGVQDTIHFRVYPHYGGAYINIDKVNSSTGLARQMIRFSDTNFLYWGADSSYDIFAGYNFTLESGFPEASFRVVLGSIPKLDEFIGQMRPSIDGTTAP